MSFIFLETLEQCNTDNNPDLDTKLGLTPLNEYELLSYLGSSLSYLKDNLNEYVEIFGPKVTSELIEENVQEYEMSLREASMSQGLQNPLPMIDVKKIWKTIVTHDGKIASIVLASLAITGAYKVYKKYFSKAAKACAGKSGLEKDACMTNYEVKALTLRKSVLSKTLKASKKTTDSKKYIDRIKSEIKRIEVKITNLKKK